MPNAANAVLIIVCISCAIHSAHAGWSTCPAGAPGALPCSDQNQLCGDPFTEGPQYHFRDRSCGMNDPNGPFFDEKHGLYHLFYQDHIGRPVPKRFPQGFEGPSWGHGVSPDLVRWTHAPVAMWNGEDWYDVHAIFTGSATIIDGVPTLMFPGICDVYPPTKTIPGCSFGYTFGVAHPANLSDPFYEKWTKSALNPIVNDTFDDPSTAWRTESGELRWIANCGDGKVGDCGLNGSQAPLYGASNGSFSDARKIGFTNLRPGECASLYPLPPLSPGTSPAAAMPKHVHKWGCKPYQDCVELGTWHDGAPGQVGFWEPFGDALNPTVMDQGSSYAAKDMWDSGSSRRVSFAWARLQPASQGSQINGDVQTLAKEVTYHPLLHQLQFAPLPQQTQLRGTLLGTEHARGIRVGADLTLGPWLAANQSDMIINVQIPNRQATLYVSIQAEVRIEFYVNFEAFDESTTFHEVEVGMLTNDPYPSIKDTLRLLSDEDTLEIRLMLDHTITEAFFQGGRVAMTVPSPLTSSTSFTLSTDTAGALVHVQDVSVWEMKSAWISTDDALRLRS